MNEEAGRQFRSLLDQRLEAAIKSSDPIVMRNAASVLVMIGGAQQMRLLAALIARLLAEARNDVSAIPYELWKHMRAETRRLTPEDRATLREELDRNEGLTGSSALIELDDSKESNWSLVRAARAGWPRPTLLNLGWSASIGSVAGSAITWLVLLLVAVWRGLVNDASEWPGIDLLVASILIGTLSVTASAALIATGGLPKNRPILRQGESLVFGLGVSIFVCALAFLTPSTSGLRSLLMGNSTLPFGGGFSLILAIASLTISTAATRSLSRWLAEVSGRTRSSALAWAASAIMATLATLLFYVTLPISGDRMDVAIGWWLVAIPAICAAGMTAFRIDESPSMFNEGRSRLARYAKSLPAFVTFVFAAAILGVSMRSADQGFNPVNTSVAISSEASISAISIMVQPGGTYDILAIAKENSSLPIDLRIAGADQLSAGPQGIELGMSGRNLSVVRARSGRLDICVSRVRASGLGGAGPQAVDCTGDPLWWLRSLLGVPRREVDGDGLLFVEAGGSLIKRFPVGRNLNTSDTADRSSDRRNQEARNSNGRDQEGRSKAFVVFELRRTNFLLNAYYGDGPSQTDWDSSLMLEQLGQDGQWHDLDMRDDPPAIFSRLLQPGKYRLCVQSLYAYGCGSEPPPRGNIMLSIIRQPRGFVPPPPQQDPFSSISMDANMADANAMSDAGSLESELENAASALDNAVITAEDYAIEQNGM